jgi:hypothetical protein
MKRKRFSEEQIIEIPKQYSVGAKPADAVQLAIAIWRHGRSRSQMR